MIIVGYNLIIKNIMLRNVKKSASYQPTEDKNHLFTKDYAAP